jgi:hypothetical protein
MNYSLGKPGNNTGRVSAAMSLGGIHPLNKLQGILPC